MFDQTRAEDRQRSAAGEYRDARIRMNSQVARSVEDYILDNQTWGERYAASARRIMGITEADQLFS